jgi:hypothetical protein
MRNKDYFNLVVQADKSNSLGTQRRIDVPVLSLKASSSRIPSFLR